MMRTLVCFAAAGLLSVFAFSARAETVAYGEAFDTLYRIDLDTRVATRIGKAGTVANAQIANISGLTTLSDGSQYAVSGSQKVLIKVDPQTGGTTVIGSLELAGQGGGQFDQLDLGLTVDCDGVLWMVSGVLQKIWTVDPRTAALTLVGTMGHAISGVVARAGALYGTGSKTDHTFYRIDKTTGAATALGDFGDAAPAYLNSVSMSFADDGTLYAVFNYVPPASGEVTPDWSDLVTLDPATGKATALGAITGPEALRQLGMKGFTVGPTVCGTGAQNAYAAPVDAPWALALLGTLLAFAGFSAARTRLR